MLESNDRKRSNEIISEGANDIDNESSNGEEDSIYEYNEDNDYGGSHDGIDYDSGLENNQYVNHDVINNDENEDDNNDNDDDDNGDGGDDNDEDDEDPLRRAMLRNELPNIILPLLIEAHQQQNQEQQQQQKDGNKSEEDLLHLACRCSQYDIVIMKIIELFPTSVQYKADNGNYPLHVACEHQKNDDVLMKLIKLFPKAVKCKNGIKKFPLHCACSGGQSDHVVMKLLDMFPRAANHHAYNSNVSTRDCNDGFALHLACRNHQISVAVIKRLVEMNRMALQVRQYHDKKYPIHCAIVGNQSIDVIKLLINEDPLALQRLNKEGESPFDIAYRMGNISYLEEMISHSSALVNMKDRFGETLLHRATAPSYGNAQSDQIYEVILHHPDIDVNLKDNDGNTPLHIATIHWHVSKIRLLLNHSFIMIEEKNNENKTPFDIMKQVKKHIDESLSRRNGQEMNGRRYIQSTLPNAFFIMNLPMCMEIIKVFEDYSTKRRYNAYLYHLSIIADL